jgi:hypothetical protein
MIGIEFVLAAAFVAFVAFVARAQDPPPPRPPLAPAALEAARVELHPENRGKLSFRTHASFDRLISADPAVQAKGAEHLLALLVAASEPAPGPAGDGAAAPPDEEAALDRECRRDALAEEFAQRLANLPLGGDGAAAVPLAPCLWENARPGGPRAFGIQALAAIRASAVDGVFAASSRTGTRVRTPSRSRCSARMRATSRSTSRALRTSARTTTTAYASGRGTSRSARVPLPPADAPTWFGPLLEAQLALLPRLWLESVSPDAEWFELSIDVPSMVGPVAVHGWLLRRGAADLPWRVVGDDGAALEVAARAELKRSSTLAGLARGFVEASDATEAEPSPDEVPFAEVMTAARLLEQGDRAAAAEPLAPLLQGAFDERQVVAPLLQTLATRLGEEMFDAFTSRRDEAAALAIARRLAVPLLAACREHGLAVELGEQFAARSAGAGTLHLPTAEWRTTRATGAA